MRSRLYGVSQTRPDNPERAAQAVGIAGFDGFVGAQASGKA